MSAPTSTPRHPPGASIRARCQRISAALAVSLGVLLLPFAQPILAAEAGSDLVVADFEGSDYGAWKASGEAFGTAPARGTLPGQMAVDGFQGKGLVNSFNGGDRTTGKLTSPPFRIERRYLQFLIGGGRHPGQTCINLVVDGRVVRTATGPNESSGGTERLDWEQWDVTEWVGRTVTLEIIDEATGGWGHINVDHIVQTDRRLPGWITGATRELVLQERYLHLPVKNGAPKRWMSITVEGRKTHDFEIELADGEPDWWAYVDVGALKGKRATIEVDKLKEDSKGLAAISLGNEIKDAEDLYHERLRPQFHFSTRRGWINDPNGLVFHEGEYHLFYQHNPYGWSWGNMHWGHAVSTDLVHWRELGEALYPDELGTMFSGSAVVDWNNTSGFQTGDEKPIVLFYTAAGGTSRASERAPFTQCIAYSLDRGRTWTKYANNPVLPHIVGGNRDPKVIWHEPLKRWIMSLYLDGNEFALFSSPDLKQWVKLSTVSIPESSECPDFFEIPIQGQPGEKRWVLYGGNGRYLVGRFDGKTFAPESDPHALHHGNCYYAAQTFSDIPESDGRRILVPWGQIPLPGMSFNQMMGLPVELTLHAEGDDLRLRVQPVRELTRLRRATTVAGPAHLSAHGNPLAGFNGELVELEADIAPNAATEIRLNLRGVDAVYNVARKEFSCRGRTARLEPVDGRIHLQILVDRTSIDIFGNHGRLYMPIGAILAPETQSFAITATGDGAQLQSLKLHPLRSAWRLHSE